MKCRKHTTDLTSTIGVCASCLHERLITVIQSQQQTDNNNNNKPTITPIQRPSRLQHTLSDNRFYNSPQITINTGTGCIGHATSSSSKHKNLIRFSSFSNLFRSSNRHGNANTTGNSTAMTSSPSGVRRRRFVRNRGVSPARSCDEDEDEFSDGSSEYESAESTSKQTPQKTPLRRGGGGGCGGGGGGRSVGGLIFCLSPLVRASPNRLWSMKGKPPVDGGGGVVAPPHLSYTKSFCANRSRKLADFGRSTDPNR